jgi:hypothetical protein
MTLPNDILTRPAAFRLNPYPLGSRTYDALVKNKSNYFLLAFKPGIALQAAELNELQEIFNLNNTLNIHFYSQWPLIGTELPTDIHEQLTKRQGILYKNPIILKQNYPLISSQIEMTTLESKLKIKFNIGWYTVCDSELNRNYWFYNFELREIVIDVPTTENPKQIYLNHKMELVKSSFTPTEEGYFFNDRSNRFINDITDGADRIKLVITSFSEINEVDANVPICKIINTGNSIVLTTLNDYGISVIDI